MATVTKMTAKADKMLGSVNLGMVTGGLRKVAMAGVGAMAMGADQVKTFMGQVDKLAERGEVAQKGGRKALRQFVTRRSDDVKKGASTITGKVEDQMSSVLGKLNVPTKSDIQELTRRIDSLSRKIDKL
jgi:poly(hydroxyalkanoate) granule-associated protein